MTNGTGISDRESIVSEIETVLEGISTANGYLSDPKVLRTKQAWDAEASPCCLYCEEFEPEEVQHFAFGMEQGRVAFVAAGKVDGSTTDINNLAQDIRKALEGSANPFSAYLGITRVVTYGNYADPTDTRFYCEVYFNVLYAYNVPIS